MWSGCSVIVLHYSVIGFHGIGCITRSNVYGGAGHNNPGGGGHNRGVIQLSVNPQVFTLPLQLKASSVHKCYAVKIVGTLLKASCKSSMGNRMASQTSRSNCVSFSTQLHSSIWLTPHGMNTLKRLIVANCFQKFFRLKFNRFFLLPPWILAQTMWACRPSSASCHCLDQ